MRVRIGENARASRAFSPIRAEYVYRILCQVNALLLSLFLEPNFDIYSLVTYILLLKIFSAKLLFIFKNLIRISMVCLPVHRSLKS
jgi:hypothetical protein